MLSRPVCREISPQGRKAQAQTSGWHPESRNSMVGNGLLDVTKYDPPWELAKFNLGDRRSLAAIWGHGPDLFKNCSAGVTLLVTSYTKNSSLPRLLTRHTSGYPVLQADCFVNASILPSHISPCVPWVQEEPSKGSWWCVWAAQNMDDWAQAILGSEHFPDSKIGQGTGGRRKRSWQKVLGCRQK